MISGSSTSFSLTALIFGNTSSARSGPPNATRASATNSSVGKGHMAPSREITPIASAALPRSTNRSTNSLASRWTARLKSSSSSRTMDDEKAGS